MEGGYSIWVGILCWPSFNQFNRFGDERNIQVIELCDEAIEKDPELVDAYVLKRRCLFSVRLEAMYKSRRNEMEASFHELSELVYLLDPKGLDAVSNHRHSFNMKGDYDQRMKYAKEALELNSSHPRSNAQYGFYGPSNWILFNANLMKGFSVSLYGMNQPEQALKWSNTLYDRSQHSRYDGFRAAINVHLNNKDAAKVYLKTFKAARPELKTLQDYEEVAPTIIKNYLLVGLKEIWDLV